MPPKKRTNIRTKQLKNARPQNLKILQLILQNTTRAPTPSSENIGRDAGKWPLFLAFYVFRFVRFKEQNLHFAPFSLSILAASSYFLGSQNSLLAPKNLLFHGYFVLFSYIFNGVARLCLYNHAVFLCFLPCV